VGDIKDWFGGSLRFDRQTKKSIGGRWDHTFKQLIGAQNSCPSGRTLASRSSNYLPRHYSEISGHVETEKRLVEAMTKMGMLHLHFVVSQKGEEGAATSLDHSRRGKESR